LKNRELDGSSQKALSILVTMSYSTETTTTTTTTSEPSLNDQCEMNEETSPNDQYETNEIDHVRSRANLILSQILILSRTMKKIVENMDVSLIFDDFFLSQILILSRTMKKIVENKGNIHDQMGQIESVLSQLEDNSTLVPSLKNISGDVLSMMSNFSGSLTNLEYSMRSCEGVITAKEFEKIASLTVSIHVALLESQLKIAIKLGEV